MSSTNLIPCPACKAQVSSSAEKCPQCGQPIAPRQSATGIMAAIVIGLIGGALLIMYLRQG